MKIYTKTGDDGSTGLIGGARVSKRDVRIECYGTVDEVNALVGSAVAAAGAAPRIAAMLSRVQDDLFVAGSDLAMPEGNPHRQRQRRQGDRVRARASDGEPGRSGR